MDVREIAPRVWRANARFGFMEQPDLSEVLQRVKARGYPVDPSNATYFIGHVTIVPREDRKGLPRLVRSTFWFLYEIRAIQVIIFGCRGIWLLR